MFDIIFVGFDILLNSQWHNYKIMTSIAAVFYISHSYKRFELSLGMTVIITPMLCYDIYTLCDRDQKPHHVVYFVQSIIY